MGRHWQIEFSIHALLAESDSFPSNAGMDVRFFYPRSPCGERHTRRPERSWYTLFLSTLSLRRATTSYRCISRDDAFSIHALLAESDCRVRRTAQPAAFSIHALLAESDSRTTLASPAPQPFLSTLSLRRATAIMVSRKIRSPVFYPRSPCGERRGKRRAKWFVAKFSIHALLAESDQIRKAIQNA